MDEKFWYLKNCDLFERLTPEQLSRLESRSRSKTFQRSSLLYLPTDRSESILLLVSGRVKIYHITGEGKQALLAFIDPGEIFGELAILESGQREEFAEAMETSKVVLIPGSEVRQLMEEHPNVSVGVTKLMGLRRQKVERRLKSLLFRSNRDRLVHLLLELAEKYGQDTVQGVLIGIKLSHQDLACIIGSTRETVTVLLGELQSEGALIIKRRQIVLKLMEQLASSIDIPTPQLVSRKDVSNHLPRRTPVDS
jgi:CRP/FNR family cyclic AMP-dependent transcriptional regulator